MPTIADVERLRLLRFRRDASNANGANTNNSANSAPERPAAATVANLKRKCQGGDDSTAAADEADRKRPRGCGFGLANDETSSASPSPRPSSSSSSSCLSTSSSSSSTCGSIGRHPPSSSYADVLLQPELLYELRKEEEITASSNPLLEFCLDGGLKTAPSSPEPAATTRVAESDRLPPLLELCSSEPFNQERVEELRATCSDLRRQKGCDYYINAGDSKGQTAMHYLINGCTRDSFYCTLQGMYLLLSAGADLTRADRAGGDTPLTALRALLGKRELHTEAVVLAHLLVQQARTPEERDALVNHADRDGRTLLTYAAADGDRAAGLTRLLLNAGASVWRPDDADGGEDVAVRVAREREGSAFTWFLRALSRRPPPTPAQVKRRNSAEADNTPPPPPSPLTDWGDQTLYLLGHAAASAEDPDRLRDHLTRVMLRLGRSERSEGPIFAEVRRRLAPFWSQPQSLKFLCLRRIRGTIGPKNMSDASGLKKQLDIPNIMLQYLQLA